MAKIRTQRDPRSETTREVIAKYRGKCEATIKQKQAAMIKAKRLRKQKNGPKLAR